MTRILKKTLRILAWTLLVVALTLLGARIYNIQQGPPLAIWHTYVPDEFTAKELDQISWQEYLAREKKLFADVHRYVSEKLAPEDDVGSNRYSDGARVNPNFFSHDWNRSYTLAPAGEPLGVVVLLHGLTDSPYSLRHIAGHYQSVGYAVVAIRLPGHGTVPASLTDVEWEDWMAATRLAVREARRWHSCMPCRRWTIRPWPVLINWY